MSEVSHVYNNNEILPRISSIFWREHSDNLRKLKNIYGDDGSRKSSGGASWNGCEPEIRQLVIQSMKLETVPLPSARQFCNFFD